MSPRSARGPFRPATGARPPYLAGREREQKVLRALLTDLDAGIPPGTQVILHGPRGNGKTVLLRWLEGEAGALARVATDRLRPSEIPDQRRLGEGLLPRSWWDRLKAGEFSIGGFSWRPGTQPAPRAGDILLARARPGPLVLLVDEAHTLELEVGRALLNAAQDAGSDLPFLLVLAGTPDLEDRLNAMGVSFWSRARQLRIGRLDKEAAAEAFRRPFRRDGFDVAEDAMALMVRESQCYPYFVQLLGDEVWRRVHAPAERHSDVSRDAVEAALPRFRQTRNHYYRQRANELRKRDLLPAARAVAEAFRGRTVVSHDRVQAAVRAADAGQADAAFRTLQHLGLIWEADFLQWEPGIPSLMDYLRDRIPA